ncbi:oligosaccharide biosynthesis protein Alg14 like-domain-containing protein [Phyllosticta capitalensis]|uniref:UDP-N-acetylglucosamine transferase subunit ALG14 n=1 Tax=Phyllosticta capitalensis TaxID=121624 RepID=A0ABR1YBL0_9PEZI
MRGKQCTNPAYSLRQHLQEQATMSQQHPPLATLFLNGFLILALLSVPFLVLRLIFILPPLRLPPRPRKRPGDPSLSLDSAATSAKAKAGSSNDEASEFSEIIDFDASIEPTRLLVVLGSGGHTAEMMAMLGKLDKARFLRSWSHRTYVVSEGDGLSAERAREFEEGLLDFGTCGGRSKHGDADAIFTDDEKEAKDVRASADKRDGKEIEVGSYDIQLVPRARKIHQSLLTTPFSSLRCLGACHSILRSPFSSPDIESSTAPQHQATFFPNLILTNGPGTGVIVILAALLLRYCDLGDLDRTSRIRTVYVESWARVKRLSLSGKLLLRVVDRFLVQWETLLDQTAGRGEYLGVLI